MKKKIAAALAATFALGVTSAFAANPFVDVPAKHWAYESVNKLAKAGIVDGYGDGTFRGDKTMSRYEMAQIVAKAMTKVDKADAEQKAMINKLSAEFSTELGNLGVRVGNLEKNQPNVKFVGDFQNRYTSQSFSNTTATSVSAQYRLRLDGTAKVDNDTTFGFRFVTREPDKAAFANTTWQTFGENTQSAAGVNATTGGSQNNIDRAFINAKIGNVTTTIGRQALWLDAQGAMMDSGAFSFDGVKAVTKVGDYSVTGTWGRVLKGVVWAGHAIGDNGGNNLTALAGNLDVASIMAGSKVGKFDYSLAYMSLKNPNAGTTPFKWTVLNTNYKFDNKFNFNAEYLTNGGTEIYAGKGKTFMALKATYGDLVLAKKGDNNFNVQYVDKKANSSPNHFTALGNSTGTATVAQSALDFKQWDFQYKYAFSKSFIGTLEYTVVKSSDATVAGADNNMVRAVAQVMF